MKKRWLCLLLALVMALPLASCAGDRTEGDGITLTLMGKRTDLEKSYMTDIFARYEQATGNTLRLLSVEDAAYEQQAAERFASGKAPDVFLHFNDADLRRFDVENDFCYLNDEAWAADLTDGARAYCQDSEGNLLGLPFWESSVSGCYYNKTLLEELDLNPASTQKEFDMLCQALAAVGLTPICWPAKGCTWMMQLALDPIFADDPDLLERLNRNEITYADIPAVTAMVQWVADAADKGWFGTDYLATGWDEIGPAMSSGQAVMTFIWDTWFYTDLTPGGPYTVDDFALMPVFMNTADGGTYEGGNLNMMMVSKNSAHQQQALEFLAFCAEPENYNAAFDGISTVSCFRGQTTNIQSRMVTEASQSIAQRERVSTAAPKIVGYSAADVGEAFESLLWGRTDVAGCVALMDEYRIRQAGGQGAPGFPPPD